MDDGHFTALSSGFKQHLLHSKQSVSIYRLNKQMRNTDSFKDGFHFQHPIH
jgi:hypothetical protein